METFYWQNTDVITWIDVIGGNSIPTERFYKKKGPALLRGLLCERKLANFLKEIS
jgi:hypothetical protein